ncbi:uncharacterized protein LOC132922084 [Rhopalosiphum padi]|uniref:uncharacterized protein LOC132922084 n=1 Tax=Rhopalosiphum padi TaxID=40932 RepID=UPI00298E0DA2|nr:uncharacterized protein LOC132922084 [Rhopalosiphum padi]
MSHAVVSVFALAVLLNVFYFDPAQSYESADKYNTCELCIKSVCHRERHHDCVPGGGDYTLCYMCNKQTLDKDQQFYTQADCQKGCSNPALCKCDDACWVCVINGNAEAMRCGDVSQVYDDNCKLVPNKRQ